jgi:predicted nucleotidyltransferase
MTQLLTQPTLADIRKSVSQLVAQFHPQRVILFGSYAGGHPTSDSDVDLLVTMHTTLTNVEQAVAIRRAVDFPFPTDLIVRTPEQLNARLELDDNFFREVLTKGVVLYEAANT